MPLESKIKTIPLHCWHDNNITLKATQGEGGIKLCEFQLFDDNGIISLADVTSVLYNGEKSNGQVCCITCNIVDSAKGLVEFTVETGVTDISGDVSGSIEVISANGSLKFSGVHLNVKKDATGKKIEASDALSALVEALNKLAQLTPEGTIALDDVVTETGTNAVQGRAIVNYISNNTDIVKYVDLGSVTSLSETPIFKKNTLYKGLCNGFSSTFGYPDNTTQIGFLVTQIPRNDSLKDYALWLLSDGSMWVEIVSAKQFTKISCGKSDIDTIKTDIQNINDTIEKLSAQLIYSEEQEYTNVDFDLSLGHYFNTSGFDIAHTSFEHSNLIKCVSGEEYCVTSTYGYVAPLAIFYDANQQFVNYSLISEGKYTTVTDCKIKIPNGVSYVAFNNKTDTTTLVIKLLSTTGTSLKSALTKTNETVTQLETSVNTNQSDILQLQKDNEIEDGGEYLSAEFTITEKSYAYYLNGVITSNDSYECTNKIPCVEGDKFRVTSSYGFNASLAVLYDNNGEYLNYIEKASSPTQVDKFEIVIPSNAKYIVFNNKPSDITLIIEKYNISVIKLKTKVENLENQINNEKTVLSDKTMYAEGDSVAFGQGNNGQSYADMIATANTMTLTKTAIGGTTIATRAGRTDSIYERVIANNNDYDYIVLEGGFNDLFSVASAKWGEVSDSYNLQDFDVTTTCGALESICYHIIFNHTRSKVLFVLAHRKNDVVLTSTSTTIAYTAKQRLLWDKIIAVLKKWGIPYVDLSTETHLSGWNTEIANKYFAYAENQGQGDGTHPNKLGYSEFYVPLITAKMKEL